MNIIVVGCGKVGSRLATNLSYSGHDVAVVDGNGASFNLLGEDFDGLTVSGIPMDQDVLRRAGIEGCDALAAVSSDDNLNITVAQIAKTIFGVPKVVTRILDPAREDVYSEFGLNTICPTRLAEEAVRNRLVDESRELSVTFETSTCGFLVRPVEKSMKGHLALALPQNSGESLFGVINENGVITLYEDLEDYTLELGEKLVFVKIID